MFRFVQYLLHSDPSCIVDARFVSSSARTRANRKQMDEGKKVTSSSKPKISWGNCLYPTLPRGCSHQRRQRGMQAIVSQGTHRNPRARHRQFSQLESHTRQDRIQFQTANSAVFVTNSLPCIASLASETKKRTNKTALVNLSKQGKSSFTFRSTGIFERLTRWSTDQFTEPWK